MLLKDARVYPHGASRELVVLLHGWGLARDRLRDLIEAIREERPDADLIVPVYAASWISRIDPLAHPEQLRRWESAGRGRKAIRRIVSRTGTQVRALVSWLSTARATDVTHAILNQIDVAVQERFARPKDPPRADQDRGYERITLIGHSIGALLARKTYVYAHGLVSDAIDPDRKPRSWARKIDRLILLSCMNRGWRLRRRPRHMGWLTYGFFRCTSPIVRRLGLGKLIFDLEWGAPFVANLRLQWMRLARDLAHPMATSVLLIGDIDDMVDRQDHKDIHAAGSQSIYKDVPETGHYDILRFGDAGSAPARGRRQAFVEALTRPAASLTSDLQGFEPDVTVERVVFLRHGIRDFGHWTRAFREGLRRLYGGAVRPETSAYRWLSLLRFSLRAGRGALVRDFMDEYTEVVARFPSAARQVGFIGHSHGTLLLARVLDHYSEARFERMALAGSVIPRNYDWRAKMLDHRVQRVRNDLAASDYAVAFGPRFVEWIRESLHLPLGEIGSGGFHGFLQDEGQTDVFQFVRGGHSAALKPPNDASLIRFVVEGASPGAQAEANAALNGMLRKTQQPVIGFLSRACWIPIVALLGGLFGLARWAHTAGQTYGDWGGIAAVAATLAIVMLLTETA